MCVHRYQPEPGGNTRVVTERATPIQTFSSYNVLQTPQVVGPDGQLHTIYWFIPKFYIIQGNWLSSMGRPVRYLRHQGNAADVHATIQRELLHTLEVPWTVRPPPDKFWRLTPWV